MVTDVRIAGKGAAIANTFFLQADKQKYLLDPACGSQRLKAIKDNLPFNQYDILFTHSHLDHCANAGAAGNKDSRILCHPLVAGKINNLKRNYTESTPQMVQAFGIRGFFGRTGMLGPAMLTIAETLHVRTPFIMNCLLLATSHILCRAKVGHIHTPKKNVCFLSDDTAQDLRFGNVGYKGWSLGGNLYALDTPGHQDDHLSYYLADRKLMFCGDLIGFLNPNDIIDGSLKDTQVGMAKMLQLAEQGYIDILAPSHTLPLIGAEHIINYLRSIISQQDEIFCYCCCTSSLM